LADDEGGAVAVMRLRFPFPSFFRLSLLFLFLALFLASTLGCSGCGDHASDTLDEGRAAVAGGNNVRAAELFEKVCRDSPKSRSCKEAQNVLPATQLAAAQELLNREEYRSAKQMAEKAAKGPKGDQVADLARKLLEGNNLAMGVKFEDAKDLDTDRKQ